MKLLSLAFLAMASTAVAEMNFTLTMVAVLDGVIGNPNTTNCINIFEDETPVAWSDVLETADTQIETVRNTQVIQELGSENVKGAQRYSFHSKSDNRCM
jgi:uncharacterized protein (DUF2141 family)